MKQHQSNLNRLIRDVRIGPNRALLAELFSMYYDATKPEDQEFIRAVIVGTFGSPRLIRWRDPEDPSTDEGSLSRTDASASDFLRDVFQSIAPPKGTDASQS